MKTVFKRAYSATQNAYARAGVAASLALASVAAHAVSPLDPILDAVDLSGIAVKVGAAALVIVGIALVFKGPALAKRIISKV